MRRIVWGLVEFAGALAVVRGVAGFSGPAAWIVGGVFALAAERANA